MTWYRNMWPWRRLAWLERQLQATEKRMDEIRKEHETLKVGLRRLLAAEPLPKVRPDA